MTSNQTAHLSKRKQVIVNLNILRKGCPRGKGFRVTAQCGRKTYSRHCCDKESIWECLYGEHGVVRYMQLYLEEMGKEACGYHINEYLLTSTKHWMGVVPRSSKKSQGKARRVFIPPKMLAAVKDLIAIRS